MGWAVGNTVSGKLHNNHFIHLVDIVLLISGVLAILRAFIG